jgi:hypothetical protein
MRMMQNYIIGLLLGIMGGISASAQWLTPPNVSVSPLGEQRTIAIPILIGGSGGDGPFTREQAMTWLNGEDVNHVNGYFKKASGGAMSIRGDVTSWISVSGQYTDCLKRVEMATAAEQQAIAQGWDVYSYSRRLYLLVGWPCTDIGGFPGGTGPTGVGYSPTWLRANSGPYGVAANFQHEMGHSLGFDHAACSGGTAPCDQTDAMGTCAACGFNPPHWWEAGWATPLDITATQTITLLPLDSTKQVIRIPKGTDGTYYFLAFLRPKGAAFLHYFHPRTSLSNPEGYLTQLVDVTPTTTGTYQFLDGTTYCDSASSLCITQLSSTTESATLNIQLGEPPPPPPPPPPTDPLTISPTEAQVPIRSSFTFTLSRPATCSITSGPGRIITPCTFAAPNGAGSIGQTSTIQALASDGARVTASVTITSRK